MVKSKKMSKTGIAVIVLALLLVLSMVMGLTGAWFTAKADKVGNQQVLHFGNVEYTLDTVTATVANAEGDVSNGYLLVAGSSITSGVKLTNKSSVNTYYGLYHAASGKLFVVDASAKTLTEVTGANSSTIYGASGLGYLAPATAAELSSDAGGHVVEFSQVYYMANYDNEGTNANIIFKLNDNNGSVVDLTGFEGWKLGEGASSAATLQFGDLVNLGGALVNGTFQLRAVQAQNIAAADAYGMLVTNWATTEGNGNPAQQGG